MTRRTFPMLAALSAFAQSPVKTDDKNVGRDYSGGQPAVKADPAILNADEKPWQQVRPGLRRKAWFNDRLTMVVLEFTRRPGEKPDAQHYHANDQMSYVMEGRIRALVGGKMKEIGPGGVFIAPSNVRHGIELLTDKVVLLDVFTPTREDFRA